MEEFYRKLIYDMAATRFSLDSQLDKLQEECMELAVECHRLRTGRSDVEALAGEIADVMNMCEQIEYQLSPGIVQEARDRKLERFSKRMDSLDGGMEE